MRFLLLPVVVCLIGCSTLTDVKEIKKVATESLTNINKISKLVIKNIGTEDEANTRKETIDTVLSNVRSITENVSETTSSMKNAARNVNMSITEVSDKINDPEKGLPEVMRLIGVSTENIAKTSRNVQDAANETKVAALNIKNGSTNIKELLSTTGPVISNIKSITEKVSDTTFLLAKSMGTIDDVATSVSEQIPYIVSNTASLTKNVKKTTDIFNIASYFIIAMAVLQLSCFVYGAYMMYRFHGQRAKFEAMETIRELTDNISIGKDGVEHWDAPSRNIIFKANIHRLFAYSKPILLEMANSSSELISKFAKDLLSEKGIYLS